MRTFDEYDIENFHLAEFNRLALYVGYGNALVPCKSKEECEKIVEFVDRIVDDLRTIINRLDY